MSAAGMGLVGADLSNALSLMAEHQVAPTGR